jgi:hypothetical protein
MKALLATLMVLVTLVLLPLEAVAQAPEGAQAPPAPPPPDKKAIWSLKIRFEREPSVAEVQRAALKFFKVHPEIVASYRSGAAWKALMPDVEFTFNNEYGNNDRKLSDLIYLQMEQSNPAFPQKELETVKRGTISFGVRAHWQLDRLIFNAETLDVSSLVGVQEGLLREITSLYFTRRRLMTMMKLSPPQDPNEEITEQLRLEEITANLDALTGGYFTKETEKRLAKE